MKAAAKQSRTGSLSNAAFKIMARILLLYHTDWEVFAWETAEFHT